MSLISRKYHGTSKEELMEIYKNVKGEIFLEISAQHDRSQALVVAPSARIMKIELDDRFTGPIEMPDDIEIEEIGGTENQLTVFRDHRKQIIESFLEFLCSDNEDAQYKYLSSLETEKIEFIIDKLSDVKWLTDPNLADKINIYIEALTSVKKLREKEGDGF